MSKWVVLSAWVLLAGSYMVVALTLHKGKGLTTFGDITQAAAAMFATAALAYNARRSPAGTKTFWLLLALGCGMWFTGQVVWTYFEVYLQHEVPNPFLGDVILFLHPVPMMAALALHPGIRRAGVNVLVRHLSFALLLVWWIYLYVFVVIPWQYIAPNVTQYGVSYDRLAMLENLLLTLGLAILMKRAKSEWKSIYMHLFSASVVYAAASYATNVAIDYHMYYTGSPFDIPLVVSFVWFGTAGVLAHQRKPSPEEISYPAEETNSWPARVAMAAVISIPLMALWTLTWSSNPAPVSHFRLAVTQVTLVVAALLMALRQSLVDRDRLRLIGSSQTAVENLRQFQTQMVQTEKLVSLGQLAAGAAHEINNPLTGILGYSDLLMDDPLLGERQRALADKIRTLARRIRTLITNLLSFARQVPSEKTDLDVNLILSNAIHLSNLDLRGVPVEVITIAEKEIPAVFGDANHLLQVVFNLISNAVDAMEEVGGGKLILKTGYDSTRVLVEVSDTGPGIKAPQQVFDPFYTTKPVGKGTGLGLSICYGIVQDHGGQIECFNRPEGGATFLVTLPHTQSGLAGRSEATETEQKLAQARASEPHAAIVARK
ncbi:MAG TPA: HAMP domain-containing sensor histidine kinase [Verrucomicrobiae bacterium]|nr:HAMP domain-containing sensor histidine kinase [Verrucomicrobiae bacterium]